MARKSSSSTPIERCPNNHAVGVVWAGGTCTSLWCAAETKAPKLKRRSPKLQAAVEASEITKVAPELKAEVAEAELPQELSTIEGAADIHEKAKTKQLGDAIHDLGRLQGRRALVKVPKNLEGAEAEEYAQKKAVSLLPEAMAEIEYTLKFGSSKERMEAADRVLDINGMRKRDAGSAGGATIILNLNSKELPWAQKVIQVAAGKPGQSTVSSPSQADSLPASFSSDAESDD